ncbi:MAG: hypothetical protein AB7S74_19060 [Hyphomicrobium sp.]
MIALLSLGALAMWYAFEQDYASKREWSIVQAAEVAGRSLPLQMHVETYENSEFGSAVGIVAVDGQTRIWILAKAQHGERLKILPSLWADQKLQIRISPEELENIGRRIEMNDEVREFLANAVERSPVVHP